MSRKGTRGSAERVELARHLAVFTFSLSSGTSRPATRAPSRSAAPVGAVVQIDRVSLRHSAEWMVSSVCRRVGERRGARPLRPPRPRRAPRRRPRPRPLVLTHCPLPVQRESLRRLSAEHLREGRGRRRRAASPRWRRSGGEVSRCGFLRRDGSLAPTRGPRPRNDRGAIFTAASVLVLLLLRHPERGRHERRLDPATSSWLALGPTTTHILRWVPRIRPWRPFRGWSSSYPLQDSFW